MREEKAGREGSGAGGEGWLNVAGEEDGRKEKADVEEEEDNMAGAAMNVDEQGGQSDAGVVVV